ncbi:MAG: hypothetical protein ACRDVZ_08335, partial [Jiangellaceae bacterium]
MSRSPARRSVVAPAVAALLLIAACSGSESPSAELSSTPSAAPATWPLTGLPVADGVSAGGPVLA